MIPIVFYTFFKVVLKTFASNLDSVATSHSTGLQTLDIPEPHILKHRAKTVNIGPFPSEVFWIFG